MRSKSFKLIFFLLLPPPPDHYTGISNRSSLSQGLYQPRDLPLGGGFAPIQPALTVNSSSARSVVGSSALFFVDSAKKIKKIKKIIRQDSKVQRYGYET